MKVLIDHGIPFALAHGGFQTHIEHTRRGLEDIGLEVEWIRWWDDRQTGDLIHAFAPISVAAMQFAATKGIPVVLTTLLDTIANQPPLVRNLRRLALTAAERVPYLRGFLLNSDQFSPRYAAHNIVNLPSQATALIEIYGVPAESVSIVPVGLTEPFHRPPPQVRDGKYLISAGTITPRKRSVELAMLARAAHVPVLFAGRPWNYLDEYWKRFQSLIDDEFILYDGSCVTEADIIARYCQARGFVFLSRYEAWSLVAHEAAACGLPLLLPSVPWTLDRFSGNATFWDRPGDDNARLLRQFFEQAPTLPRPQVASPRWTEVAETLRDIYRKVVERK